VGRRSIRLALAAVLLVACADDGSDGPPADPSVTGITVPDGFTVHEVVTGLVGPTQLAVAGDGTFVVGQLDGGEGAGTGQVLRIDPRHPDDRTVLLDDLLTPTGVAVVGDELWVMERRRLTRGSLDGGARTTVADDLAFNGRSEGSLTATSDGAVLYDTSGALDDGVAAAGSATLWSVTAGGEPVAVATGFKHAYARTFAPDGTLWQTEVADGSYDGAPAPDELVAVTAGDDFGWPQCVGDRTPVVQFGGTAERCASTPPSHALFDAGATPTSVAVAPWDDATLLVALWNAGEVVAVPVAGMEPVPAEVFLGGLEHPQHLVADVDRLLVVDFTGGRILEIRRAG
jgi:glucose/arabinose dehydrogenase